MSDNVGKLISFDGQIAEIKFWRNPPFVREILTLEGDPESCMEVKTYSRENSCFCVVLSGGHRLIRGANIARTGGVLKIPVGRELLGRALNMFGQPIDGQALASTMSQKELYSPAPRYSEVSVHQGILETGIKILDLLCPFPKGGKMGLIGGAGLGKTVMLTELMRHIASIPKSNKTVSIFAGIGERTREGHELVEILKSINALSSAVVVLGSMGSVPAARLAAGHAAVAIAEYFRDVVSSDVLFFVDNAFRFAQAGNEISTLMKALPSEDAYQPTLNSEVAALHERLVSTSRTISTVEAVYIPSDDITDAAVQVIFNHLDSVVVFSRDIYQQNLLPAVDPLSSFSSALAPQTVGALHYSIAKEAETLLRQAAALERVVSLVGESELSQESRTLYWRAKRLRNFLTQNLFVLEKQTGTKGAFVPLKVTLGDVSAILSGKADKVPPEDLLYIGSLEDIKI